MAKPIKKENALQPYEGGQNIPIPYMDLNLFLNREIETEAALQLKIQQLKEAKALVENLQKETDEAVLKMLDRNFLSVPFWKNSFLKMLGRYYPWSFELLEKHLKLVKPHVDCNKRVFDLVEFQKAYKLSTLDKDWKWGILGVIIWELRFVTYFDDIYELKTVNTMNMKLNAWHFVFFCNSYLTTDNVKKYKHKHPESIYHLSSNTMIIWNYEFLESFKQDWNYKFLSENYTLPWSEELVVWMKTNATISMDWDLAYKKMMEGELLWKRKSYDRSVTWTEELIDEYLNFWDWGILSQNPNLPFSISFLKKHEGYWKEDYLLENEDMYDRVFAPLLNDSIVDKILRLYYY